MIKHIVLFQFKPEKRDEVLIPFKTALESLMGVVKELKSIEVGVNCNPNEAWDLALVTTFDSMEDLQAYAVHPEHLKASAIIADAKQGRACVDFTVIV